VELVKAVAESAAGDGPSSVPAWSGSFTDLGIGLGVMRVYAGDVTNHRPPAGWHFVVQEPAYEPALDAEVWLLEYTGE
jgi:hypothetical protein